MWVLASTLLAGGVFAAEPACPGADKASLNLVWRQLDQNWLPLDPWWRLQDGSSAAPLPDPASPCQCGGFPPSGGGIPFGQPQCTQQTTADLPRRIHKFICGLEWFKDGRRNVARGHVNWLPVTFYGHLSFGSKSGPDDDYNFELHPLGQAPNGQVPAITQWNQHGSGPATIHVELKGEESIDRLSHPWWRDFRSTVESDPTKAMQMVDRRPASVTGLFGLDAEHKGHSELHPAFALAIQTKCDDQPDSSGWYEDEWVLLVRSAGNEGFCSSWRDLHFFDAPGRTFTVAMPDGVASRRKVQVAQPTLAASIPGALGPELVSASLTASEFAQVRVSWPSSVAPNRPVRIHGSLVLKWKPEKRFRRTCASPASLSAPLGRPEDTEWDTEKFLEQILPEGGTRPALAAPPDAHPVQMGDIGPSARPAGGLCPGSGPDESACAPELRAAVADRLVRIQDVPREETGLVMPAEEAEKQEEDALCEAAATALQRLRAGAGRGDEAERNLRRAEALVSYCVARE